MAHRMLGRWWLPVRAKGAGGRSWLTLATAARMGWNARGGGAPVVRCLPLGQPSQALLRLQASSDLAESTFNFLVGLAR